jgi:hypothetical protein
MPKRAGNISVQSLHLNTNIIAIYYDLLIAKNGFISTSLHFFDHPPSLIMNNAVQQILEPFSKVRGLFRTVSDTQSVDKKYSEKLSSYSQITDQPPLIVFPGGGIYFWWQVSNGQSERKPGTFPCIHQTLIFCLFM